MNSNKSVILNKVLIAEQVPKNSMKTLFYPEHNQVEVNWREIPGCNDDEVLLKVSACGICGSELETFRMKSNRRKPPLIMGHEFCGEVVFTGKNVKNWKHGTMAVSNSIVSCGGCQSCKAGRTNLCIHRIVFGMQRNGAFAQYVNVPVQCLIPVLPKMDFREVSLTEPLANAVHLVKLTNHVPIKNVLVIGAGTIGLMAQQAFQTLRNANTIVADIRNERLDVAKKLGAFGVINLSKYGLVEALNEIIGNEAIDVVVDAVGSHETNSKGLNVVRQGGTLLIIGLHENSKSLLSYDVVLGEKKVLGSYAATQEDMEDALGLIISRKVDVSSWVHYYNLNNGVLAFFNMMEAKGNHIKSVLVMEE